MEITNYEVMEDDGVSTVRAREAGREEIHAFAIGDNSPSHHEVHRVRNVGDERAVSLHVYGEDLTRRTLFGGRGLKVDGKDMCFAFKNDPAY